MTLQERKQKHYGFMCAALNGLIVSPELYRDVSDDKTAALKACDIAKAALNAFEMEWKEQDEQEKIAKREAFNAPNPYTESIIV